MKSAKVVTVPPIFVDLPTVATLLGVSVSTVQSLGREDPEFPKQRKLSTRCVRWLLSEIMEWCVRRPESDLLPPPNTSHGRVKLKG